MAKKTKRKNYKEELVKDLVEELDPQQDLMEAISNVPRGILYPERIVQPLLWEERYY